MTSKVTCSVTGSVAGGTILQIEVKGRRSKRLSQSSGLLTSGLRYLNGALWSRVSDGHLVVQGIQRVTSGPRYPKGTQLSKLIEGGAHRQKHRQL